MVGKKKSNINSQVAYRVKQARLLKGLSQSQLSQKLKKCGLERSVDTIRGYENQRIAPPDSVLEKIAGICDVEFWWLKGYTGPNENGAYDLKESLHQRIVNMNNWDARTRAAIDNVLASCSDFPIEYVTAFKKFNSYQVGLEKVVREYMQDFFEKEVQYNEDEAAEIKRLNQYFSWEGTGDSFFVYEVFSCKEDEIEYVKQKLEEYKKSGTYSLVIPVSEMGKWGTDISFDAEAERIGMFTFMDDSTCDLYIKNPSKRASILNDYRKKRGLQPIPIAKVNTENNNED